jgi:nitroimidazol reductase NimA-like FMN-containing flavoprotein (pyridoxamine 5'-phosphate oxidase superfamily)
MSSDLPDTPRTHITRLGDRQVFDRDALNAILDSATIAHVGFVRDGEPIVLPVGIGRDGDTLLIHGSTGSPFFRDMSDGRPLAITVTHLEGLVYARSAFDSSMNYRSAMIRGCASVVDTADKEQALHVITEHLMPGRASEVRPHKSKELAATLVLRVPLTEASVKISQKMPDEEPDDGDPRIIWAGVLPLRVVAGDPLTSELTPTSTPVASSVLALQKKLS